MKIDLRFLVYCESTEWWWNDYFAVPRVGEIIYDDGESYKVREVSYTNLWATITVERI